MVSLISGDEFIEERASFEDMNPETIDKFKKLAEDRVPSIASEKSHKAILEKLNLMDKGRPKRAAILLFGKNPQRFYTQAFLKIGKFLNEADIISSDIVEGNLFEQLDNTLETLRNKYLISEIKYEGIHRRDILEYPHDALREGIINALIHRDYVGTSSIQVRVYSDKFVIMNEGKLPPEVPLERLKMDHLSKPRNVLLAKVFYFAGLIESWGRGTIRIVENCLQHGLPEPDFIEESGVMKIIFYKERWTEEKLRVATKEARSIRQVIKLLGL
jgi:ATP-dependent DNA helicase RecG